MNCKFCNKEIPLDHVDRLCDRCWELKIRIDTDPDLAGRLYRAAIEERAKNSVLGQDLHDAVMDHVVATEAWESDENSDVSDWADVYKNGRVGLVYYSDRELLTEFALVESSDLDGAAATLDPEFAEKLAVHPLWLEVLADIKKRKEEHGELETEDRSE